MSVQSWVRFLLPVAWPVLTKMKIGYAADCGRGAAGQWCSCYSSDEEAVASSEAPLVPFSCFRTVTSGYVLQGHCCSLQHLITAHVAELQFVSNRKMASLFTVAFVGICHSHKQAFDVAWVGQEST